MERMLEVTFPGSFLCQRQLARIECVAVYVGKAEQGPHFFAQVLLPNHDEDLLMKMQ